MALAKCCEALDYVSAELDEISKCVLDGDVERPHNSLGGLTSNELASQLEIKA